MNSQTASWNRLEVLLNEASVKKQSVTPKNTQKSDDVPQPTMLKCLRAKKFQRTLPSSNPVVKGSETIISDRDNTYNNVGSIQSKTTFDGVKTLTAVQSAQICSIEELGQDSPVCSDELRQGEEIDENEVSQGEVEEEENMELECPRIKSSDAAGAPTALFNLRFKQQQQKVRRSSCGNKFAMRKYKPVCGLTDLQIRELYRLKCQDLGIAAFADSEESFVQGTKKKSTNSKLCLFESGFGPRALEKLGQIIHDNAQVAQLFLRKCNLNGESIRPFARSLAKMPSLMHLELANNSLEPQDFIVLFEELANSNTLVSIDFSNYEPDKKNRFTAECLDAFRKFAHENIFLQYVKFTNLMLEDEVIQGILSTLEQTPNLLCLNLASNNCTGKSLDRLPAMLSQTSIIQLDFSNNKLKKEGAQQLAKAIQGFKGSQREGLDLIMENTQLGADVNLIFAAFGRETNIMKLNLSNNFLSNVDIIRLENALSHNIKLMELNLSHCKLGEIGGRILALGLQKNTWIQNLILVDNDLGDAIGAQIIHALTHNHSLKAIDVSQNQLASDSAKAVQEMVKKNPNVEKYNLSMNKFNEKEGYLLQEVLYFNDKITQFNVHHNPVKYNTIETIERIVRDNVRKLVFQTVPKLKHEVARRRVYVEGEKHAMEETVAMERVKGDVKRDVERFRETLNNLKNRSESPSIRRNEKMVAKLGKEIKSFAKEQNEAIMKVRSFTDEAFIEKESFKNELDGVEIQIKQINKKIEAKKKEMEKVSEKYEPEIKKLRAELAQLREENKFVDMYNETISRKIRKEKKKAAIVNRAPNPKISDMFLATSELARHKKKEPVNADKTGMDSKSHIGGLESQLHFSQVSEDPKIAREYNFALKSQHFRINKMMKENENKEAKKKKKRLGKESTPEDLMRERIKLKIKNLLKDIESNKGNILGQVADN